MENYLRWATIPNQQPPRISVVIPTANDAWRIVPTIGAVASYMCERGQEWELIVSDDDSADPTREMVADLDLANLRLIQGERRTGAGGAVRRGVAAAKGDYILIADPGLTTPIEQLDHLLATMIAEGADIAIGARRPDMTGVDQVPAGRRILSAGLRRFATAACRLTVRAPRSGFDLFTSAAAHQLFAVQRLNGASYDLEVLFIARTAGLRIVEVPVEPGGVLWSRVDRAAAPVSVLRDVPRIHWNGVRGRYRRTRAYTA